MTTQPGGPVSGKAAFTPEPGEEIIVVIDETKTASALDDVNTVMDALETRPRFWAAVKHQAYLHRKVYRIARLVVEHERIRDEAVALIRAENRKLHRRALEAEGFIAACGLENTYGIRDTARRPVSDPGLAHQPDRAAP